MVTIKRNIKVHTETAKLSRRQKIMKGKLTATICLLMLSLVTFAFVAQTKAAPPTLSTFAWVEPDYKGTDTSLSGDPEVIGYRENTNWTFTMSWTNDAYVHQINISAIRIYFSWGKNYTHSFATPVTVETYQTQSFTITDVTPNVTDASELWRHSYAVYIHHVNSTTAPMGEAGSSPLYVHYGSNFVILSSDHLTCLELWSRLNYALNYGPMVTAGASLSLVSSDYIAKVEVLMAKAEMEYGIGTGILNAGVYGQAKTHLQTAENLYNEALTTWDERGTAMEDADMNFTKSETAYNYALANAANVNAYGWLLFGLGWTFIGLGVIIYGLRRPKVAQS